MTLIDQAKNFAKVTVSTGYDASATSIALSAGHGARLPTAPFNATWWDSTSYPDPSDDPNAEIVRVTAKATDTLTITRAQESTTASAKNTAGKVYKLLAGPTARLVNIEVYPTHYNVKSFGLVGDGVTDDTTAAQQMISTIVTEKKGGKLYWPRGEYLMAGPLQGIGAGTGAANAQIPVPGVDDSDPTVTIDMIGETAPSYAWYFQSIHPTGDTNSIIRSTFTAANDWPASLFKIVMHGGAVQWSNVMLNFKDMVIRLPANPKLTAIDTTLAVGNRIESTFIYAGNPTGTPTEPTLGTSMGVKLAAVNHSAYQRIEGLTVLGFYRGVQLGELTVGKLICYGCHTAIYVPFSYHASTFDYLGAYDCRYGIVAAGVGYTGFTLDDGTHYLAIQLFDFQNANGAANPWQDNQANVDDPSNLLHGNVRWLGIDSNLGRTHTLVKNGGTNLLTTEVGT